MQRKKDPSDLLSKIFHEDYPLNNNTLSIIIGGSGSGKSYFCYNVLTPLYIENFDIFHLLICSKTAKCDKTLENSLKVLEKDYPYLQIDLISISEVVSKCEEIRSNSLKAEYCERLLEINDYIKFNKFIDKEIEEKMESMNQFKRIQDELYLFIDDLRELLEPNNYNIKEINKKVINGGELSSSSDDDLIPDKRALFTDENNYDINYVVYYHGLGINKKVFENKETQPIIEVDYKGREEIDNKEWENIVYSSILKYIKNEIIKPRVMQKVFGDNNQSILVIIDDNVGDSELSNMKSQLTQLVYLRRHLHTSLFILSQSATGINTNIRRNTNSFHLLPSISNMDLKLINDRLPAQLGLSDIRDNYLCNCENKDRNQRMTSLFCVFPYNKVVDGAPPCVYEYYNKIT